MNRRHFLKSAAASTAAVAAPTIIPSSALGRDGATAPSERIVMGVVGWGMMGPGNTDSFMSQSDCQVVAACDIDKNHLASAVKSINDRNKNEDCKAYHDYREMMARDDIDAVMLALPDNWHTLTAVEAAKNGKHIYGEKPLSRTIAEQQAIVKAVEDAGVTWQTGSWQRSVDSFRQAAEIVRNGLLGKITRVEVGLPGGHNDFAGTKDFMTESEPPAELDYEMWIGPSAMQPYIKGRVHKNWRWDYNVGGGQLLDWIGHHCDIAHWGMDWDNTGPSEVSGTGEFPPRDAVWNTATSYKVECTYPDGTPMTIASAGTDDIRMGTKWIGENGWVWVDRGGFEVSNPDWKQKGGLPDDLAKVRLFNSPGHHRNFLDCIKSGDKTITPVGVAHRSAIPGHLGLIALITGETLGWNPDTEELTKGSDAAKALLGRDYRDPWKMPA
ncbi:Gfo/Idh/MocA family oxidoreductase [soil metagenome]